MITECMRSGHLFTETHEQLDWPHELIMNVYRVNLSRYNVEYSTEALLIFSAM